MEKSILTVNQRVTLHFLLALMCLGLAPVSMLLLSGSKILVGIGLTIFVSLFFYGLWKKLWGLVVGVIFASFFYSPFNILMQQKSLNNLMELLITGFFQFLNIGGPGAIIAMAFFLPTFVSMVMVLLAYLIIKNALKKKHITWTKFETRLDRVLIITQSTFFLMIPICIATLKINSLRGNYFIELCIQWLFLLSIVMGIVGIFSGIIYVGRWLKRERA